jgi:FKBP-type peptidyl-prolyl cis-trans isomerase
MRTAIALALTALLTACTTAGFGTPVVVEEASLQSTSTGVRYADTRVGEGARVVPGMLVTVHYVGKLDDGHVFDSSEDRGIPLDFTVGAGQVVSGWEDGMVGMRVGGHRRIVIPPERGFGAEGNGDIPPNATVTLEVDLLEAVSVEE